ncbi:MAG: BatA domain-containing protein [Flavobacteriales bacterium]|nr:BatA domain-containing protein [Flavobacteriales bacterium]
MWGLLFLIVPVLIHLFNFRKAKIIYFTRVDLLEELKTKKSSFSSLKKRLILFSRLMTVFFVVIAFTYPYFSDLDLYSKNKRAVFLCIDNSFSMQAKAASSELFTLAKIDITDAFGVFSNTNSIYLLSNDRDMIVDEENDLAIKLSSIDYSAESFSSLKLKSRVSDIIERDGLSEAKLIVFSDFKEEMSKDDSLFSSMDMIRKYYKAEDNLNISVDSIWIKKVELASDRFTVNYRIKNTSSTNKIEYHEQIVLDGVVQQSLTKVSDAYRDSVFELDLVIPKSRKVSGVINIEDNALEYDNDLFFSVDFTTKSKVLFVGGNVPHKLKSLLNDAFMKMEYADVRALRNIELSEEHFLIFVLSPSLSSKDLSIVSNYMSSGRDLLIVPGEKLSRIEFNSYLSDLGIGSVLRKIGEQYLSHIDYENDFFSDIFNSRVDNFEYPLIKNTYSISSPNSQKLLELENGDGFLLNKIMGNSTVYIFSSDVFSSNSKFLEYDLSLPILYKMVSLNSKNKMYGIVGEQIDLSSDNSNLQIKIGEELIPFSYMDNGVLFFPKIENSGNYKIVSGDTIEKYISVNYPRKESDSYVKVEGLEKEIISYDEISEESSVEYLWKWSLTLAFMFLLIELSLILFFKEKR